MAFIDYYKIMGIDKDTPQSDIREAYKRRAKQFHPDLHPNDPKAKAKFQALNEAYDVLNSPEKRKKYDQYGENWKNADAFNQQQSSWGQGSNQSGFDDMNFDQFNGMGGGFSSFFEQLFGRRGRRGGQEASGFGGFGNTSNQNANANGSVNIDMYTALLGGEIVLQTQHNKLRLKVKPGTQNGMKVRLRGKGYQRSDGSYGDLIITYNVVLPTSLNERQQQLLREVQAAG